MEPLNYEGLTTEKKMYLGGLMQHPGYSVLKELIEDACDQMTRKVIKLKPENPDYVRLLPVYQMEANVANDFAATLIKSIKMHSMAGEIEQQTQKIENEVEKLNQPMSDQFGSVKLKAREGK